VNDYDLNGRVVAGVKDCELSIVKAGRAFTDTGVFQHVGCTNHRFECTTGIAFDGPRARMCNTLARTLITRYIKSSQAAD